MKRRDLIKLFEKNGWYFLREGGRHDIYTNGKAEEPIPRHKEINRPPRKLISGFKINDSADQIQPQEVTHSAITIGIFHNPKNLDLSIDVFNENAFM